MAVPTATSFDSDEERAVADMLGRGLGARVRLGNDPPLAARSETG
ncbi:hypothetical protein QFZ63_000168 [Streptomyces sp. B3I7]|nr:hypothetical protein [Streptomyces sp. B3I7]MDQ0808454.1 hypothetical protein [Streptomyces sp. B3I7]